MKRKVSVDADEGKDAEMTATRKFDTRKIMKAAHEMCRLRMFSAGKARTYASMLADCLRSAWKAAKQAALRIEQNINGIPVASCQWDMARRPVGRILGRRSLSMGE